jgi:hypothetical protein
VQLRLERGKATANRDDIAGDNRRQEHASATSERSPIGQAGKRDRRAALDQIHGLSVLLMRRRHGCNLTPEKEELGTSISQPQDGYHFAGKDNICPSGEARMKLRSW